MTTIKSIKIHPAIGIARLGNSPADFFVGPEKPGVHTRPRGGYRDSKSLIKRQAARFRLFGYDKNGKVVQEITAKDAIITWTVHLANKKAEWIKFQGPKSATDQSLRRNKAVANRNSLIIDPGPRSLNAPNQQASFDTGAFLGAQVPLGDLQTDKEGHLLVLGGFGHSSSPKNAPLTTFANNDGWHDDVSDGPVTATVKFKSNGATVAAVGAWVIVGATKFAPPIDNVITLYDVLLQVAVDKLGLKLPAKPSFTKDIYPLLQRAIKMKWVSNMVAHPMEHTDEMHPEHELHHGEVEGPAHATLADIIPPPGSASDRAAIFDKLRDPALPPTQTSGESDMPMIHSDFYPAEVNQPLTIEAGWLLRDTYTYSEPFRLDSTNLKPGDVTKQMALPWQADFIDCAQEGELAWWPAQRPDDVFPETGGPQVPWIRNIVNSSPGMVRNWHRLGFVVKKGRRFVETERNP